MLWAVSGVHVDKHKLFHLVVLVGFLKGLLGHTPACQQLNQRTADGRYSATGDFVGLAVLPVANNAAEHVRNQL